MPLIRSIEKTADGVRITRTTGEVLSIAAADIPAAVKNKTTADVEAWINQWFTSQGWFSACKVRSIAPLDVDVALSDKPIEMSAALMFR